jgi:hypothetical protein
MNGLRSPGEVPRGLAALHMPGGLRSPWVGIATTRMFREADPPTRASGGGTRVALRPTPHPFWSVGPRVRFPMAATSLGAHLEGSCTMTPLDQALARASGPRPLPTRRSRPASTMAPLIVFVVALAGLGARPAPARTQSEGAWDAALAASLSGTWTLAVSASEARASLDQGIAAATASLPPVVDSLAASQLRARLVISPSITLSVTPARIEARLGHATFDSVPGVAATVPVPSDTSTTMQVVQLLRAGRLEQVFTTDGGRRWSTFTPSADGTRLTLDAIVRSERLPTDVRFSIPYRRAG